MVSNPCNLTQLEQLENPFKSGKFNAFEVKYCHTPERLGIVYQEYHKNSQYFIPSKISSLDFSKVKNSQIL